MLDREVKSAQQTHGAFSLLFLDLDYFKTVNDTLGHLMGSQLLVEMAHVLKGCVRDRDVAVRYGGDEYVVLLRGTDSSAALKVAERIRRAVEKHRFLVPEGHALSLSTCIGVASFPEHTQDKATLLDLADRAMYRGKKGSRNVVYRPARTSRPRLRRATASPPAAESGTSGQPGARPRGRQPSESRRPRLRPGQRLGHAQTPWTPRLRSRFCSRPWKREICRPPGPPPRSCNAPARSPPSSPPRCCTSCVSRCSA
ncbi:GGDEF domain-containing protein [Cystobacter fuscus]